MIHLALGSETVLWVLVPVGKPGVDESFLWLLCVGPTVGNTSCELFLQEFDLAIQVFSSLVQLLQLEFLDQVQQVSL